VVSKHDGKAWIEYDVGAGTIAINNLAADKWRPTKDGPSLAFEVADFQSAVDSLRASGAIFYIEPISTGVCQFTVISDPDGNSVTIHQRNSK
jgi:predicted enzyme related to lactoylglutathione lyase